MHASMHALLAWLQTGLLQPWHATWAQALLAAADDRCDEEERQAFLDAADDAERTALHDAAMAGTKAALKVT
jgi:hypothetical protein